jgi:hypothetical protein
MAEPHTGGARSHFESSDPQSGATQRRAHRCCPGATRGLTRCPSGVVGPDWGCRGFAGACLACRLVCRGPPDADACGDGRATGRPVRGQAIGRSLSPPVCRIGAALAGLGRAVPIDPTSTRCGLRRPLVLFEQRDSLVRLGSDHSPTVSRSSTAFSGLPLSRRSCPRVPRGVTRPSSALTAIAVLSILGSQRSPSMTSAASSLSDLGSPRCASPPGAGERWWSST